MLLMTNRCISSKPLDIISTDGKWMGTFRYEKFLNKWFFVSPSHAQTVSLVETENLPKEVIPYIEYDNVNWEEKSYYVPIKVQIQLNAHCNYQCPICYASSLKGKPLKDDFTLEQLEKLFTYLKNWGVLRINFVGGEIFMRKDIDEIFNLALSKNLLASCITNGRIPGAKIEHYKGLLKRLFNVQVSCNGIGKSYEDEYGTGNWDAAKECITNVIASTRTNILSYVITEQNYQDIPAFIQFASTINPTVIKFGTICWSGRSFNDKAVNYYKQVLPKSAQLIEDSRTNFPHLKIQSQIDQGEGTPLWEEFTNGYRPLEFYYAPEGRDGLYIKSNGDIFPFPLLSDRNNLILGNVHYDNLNDLWLNNPILKQIRDVSFANSECGKIGCKKVCGLWGRSYAIAWSSDFHGKVPCRLTNWN